MQPVGSGVPAVTSSSGQQQWAAVGADSCFIQMTIEWSSSSNLGSAGRLFRIKSTEFLGHGSEWSMGWQAVSASRPRGDNEGQPFWYCRTCSTPASVSVLRPTRLRAANIVRAAAVLVRISSAMRAQY